MPGECFKSIDASMRRHSLGKLHDLVVRGHGRIQITRRGCDQACVLISQAELDALERALEIFAATPDFKQMSDEIAQAASLTVNVAAPVASA